MAGHRGEAIEGHVWGDGHVRREGADNSRVEREGEEGRKGRGMKERGGEGQGREGGAEGLDMSQKVTDEEGGGTQG